MLMKQPMVQIHSTQTPMVTDSVMGQVQLTAYVTLVDSHPLDPALPVNTDGDAFPDEDPDGEGGLIADDDDDNDGYLDTEEVACLSDPLDVNDVPSDMDGDGICDALDDDMDGDGILNDEETNTGDYIDDQDALTDANPDSMATEYVTDLQHQMRAFVLLVHDAFPTDPAASLDTDGDGMPDEISGESTTGLIEDDDDETIQLTMSQR